MQVSQPDTSENERNQILTSIIMTAGMMDLLISHLK